jgi:glycosidase
MPGAPASLFDTDFQSVIDAARDHGVEPPTLTASPADWRDQWIYFLIIDRFNNRLAAPRHAPYDDPQFAGFQGGTFRGVAAQVPYLKELGAGAIWISPALRNLACEPGSYHGYGIHDFLRAEPRFAENPANADDELRELVDAAHAAGLYVILDIVLNHAGTVFLYECNPGDGHCHDQGGREATFHQSPMDVLWRDSDGVARHGSTPIEQLSGLSRDGFVWPKELQRNDLFRRQGLPGPGDDTVGDFASLRQFRSDSNDVQRFLIRAYQYVLARYDVDGFRIDTLKYLKNDLPRLFGNATREAALQDGKRNFFTFGEVFDSEETIARFIGRQTRDRSDLVGVDAALDFPLRFVLPGVVKGFASPAALAQMYQHRKDVEKDVLSSHGDATRFFVTFLDNHDVKERIRFEDPAAPTKFDAQVTLGLACLFSLQGIPCVYYGTEQGLHGRGSDEAVREALWGGPGFNVNSALYRDLKQIAALRRARAPLRYGRQYFRPVSGDGVSYSVSPFPGGIVSFSRILNDEEIVVVANTGSTQTLGIDVIVDQNLSAPGDRYVVLYSNNPAAVAPQPVAIRPGGSVSVAEVDGSVGTGPLNAIHVTLGPMEVQILGR